MKRAISVLEFFKSILLSVLIVSMVVLASVYIASTQSERLDFGKDIVFDRLFDVKDNESGFNSAHILPEIIGIKKNGDGARAMIANSGYLSDMYEMVMPYLTDMFGENGICNKIDGEDGEALWRECISSDDYVYVRYHTQYPASVLYAHCKNADDNDVYRLQESAPGYVYELFISESGLVTRDKDGNVMKFTVNGDNAPELPDLDRYMTRLKEFSFAIENDAYTSVYYGTPIFNDSITVRKAIVDNPVLSEFGNVTGEKFRELMRNFDFNPDKLNSYVDTEDKNASMFVESHGVLKMSTHRLEYTASADGGISVFELLNYQAGSSGYDPYDYLRAAERFADALKEISSLSFGGDAVLGISYIGYIDGALVVEYSYYFDNLQMKYGEDGIAFRFEIKDGIFTHIVINPLSVSYSGAGSRSFSQDIVLALCIKELEDASPESINMRMKYSVHDATGAEVGAEWEIIK